MISTDFCTAVDGPVHGVVDGGHLAQAAEVSLPPPTDVVTGGAADEAPLRVPMRCLAF